MEITNKGEINREVGAAELIHVTYLIRLTKSIFDFLNLFKFFLRKRFSPNYVLFPA